MANDKTGRLPSPHDCIEVSVRHFIRCTWYVEYTGTPAQLVAAGIVDRDMEQKIRSAKGGARANKDGLSFKLVSWRVPAHIQWGRDEAVGFKFKVTASEQALRLPGVAALYPNGLPTLAQLDDAIRANPGPGDLVCGSLSVQACVYAEAVGRVVSRCRTVGRFQRIMRWSLINDTVIAPDWASLVRERLAGGAS